jgi:uncharacterized protein YebE (UPF0316 family)
MSLFLAALLIFCLRVIDVSIGTMRMLYTVQGRRYRSAGLALLESGIFIFALSRVMKDVDKPWNMLAYAMGFATGNFMGITIERLIASGTIIVRIVAKNAVLIAGLREARFGVTMMAGEGMQGDVVLLFVVSPRRRQRELLKLIEQLDPEAFVTIDSVHHALGGFLAPPGTPAASVRK